MLVDAGFFEEVQILNHVVLVERALNELRHDTSEPRAVLSIVLSGL